MCSTSRLPLAVSCCALCWTEIIICYWDAFVLRAGICTLVKHLHHMAEAPSPLPALWTANREREKSHLKERCSLASAWLPRTVFASNCPIFSNICQMRGLVPPLINQPHTASAEGFSKGSFSNWPIHHSLFILSSHRRRELQRHPWFKLRNLIMMIKLLRELEFMSQTHAAVWHSSSCYSQQITQNWQSFGREQKKINSWWPFWRRRPESYYSRNVLALLRAHERSHSELRGQLPQRCSHNSLFNRSY